MDVSNTIRLLMTSSTSMSAYIALPGHPEGCVPGIVGSTLSLDELINDYNGPRINLDFDKTSRLIGIEILA